MRFLALLVVVGCATKSHDPPPPPLPAMPPAEAKRAEDACKAYVDRVCACTSEPAQRQCPLAKPMPDALKLALEVVMNPASRPEDAARAQVNVRETVKECIEQTAKLPALGCP